MTGHSSVMPINRVIGANTLIDYLSFTWAPDELRRMTDLAKQGALLKAIPRFDTANKAIQAAFAAPAVEGLRYLWKRPVGFAPLARFDKVTERLCEKASPKPLAVKAPSPVLTPSMTEMMEQALHSGYKSRADMRQELKAVCSALLEFSEFEVVQGAKYWEAYNDLIDCYGVQFLDALCCNEIELWLEELNTRIGVPIPEPRFTMRPRRSGLHGYANSADLLCDGLPCGLIGWGAANHGCMVSFSGVGCAALDFQALHDVISHVPGLRITRVDLALDDYSGEHITYQGAIAGAEAGEFHPQRGRAPSWMKIESGEFVITELAKGIAKRFGMVPTKGCSFYVGSRINGKCARVYEKGKQMQSAEYPNWVRAEGELHNKDRVIPLDVLVNPDPYFAGMYPQFDKWLAAIQEAEVKPVRLTTFKNKFKTSRDNAVFNMSRMAGRLVNWLANIEGLSPEKIVNQLTAHLEESDIPARLRMPLPPDLDELPVFST
ncbi:replication initiation factor domain-containing protein [Aeromonas caviae]|uniref:replication initiation factor domain-containing protein n=1 Tax=Aeromonas caviae TaxID=648 RepID=UPI0029D4FE26|nr:replication initiation factor domain-containing protein [Aeromonas caviae]MDX7682016.1 replication initiation factor domain-containing protein [Aeromonas caviae]MDX7868269.1 replication initiation factor domain-containing protein [Aeromonas caviae]